MAVFIKREEDGKYHCPVCTFVSGAANTIRQHCPQEHGFRATTRQRQTAEERTRLQCERMRTFRAARKEAAEAAATADKSLRRLRAAVPRAPYTVVDADERGVYGATNPFVEYRLSEIRGAGNGIFACVALNPGDVVTRYDGTVTYIKPADPSYTLAVPSSNSEPKYIDGLRAPQQGCGLGSFVNKETRARGLKRKNCEIVQVGTQAYVEMVKPVVQGDELYTTYSKGFRLAKM